MKLTIFTPTYNRAYCLDKLYESLERQTSKDFVWLIVDDGSTDNTNVVVEKYKKKASFPILYVKQKNGGKHSAYNRAVILCETELFICVDSDDYLTADAVEIIIKEHDKNINKNLLGYYYKRLLPNGSNMSKDFPKGITKIGITDLYHKYDFKGETAIVLRTKLIKGFYFPTFSDEKFVSERVLYNKYNEIAPMIIIDKGIYISEYLTDGYTRNGDVLRARNPYGTALDYLSESYYSTGFLTRSKFYAQYLAFCQVFSLDKSKFDEFEKPSCYIKIAGHFIVNHYNRIFAKLKVLSIKAN